MTVEPDRNVRTEPNRNVGNKVVIVMDPDRNVVIEVVIVTKFDNNIGTKRDSDRNVGKHK